MFLHPDFTFFHNMPCMCLWSRFAKKQAVGMRILLLDKCFICSALGK